jgi:hypothetical protein
LRGKGDAEMHAETPERVSRAAPEATQLPFNSFREPRAKTAERLASTTVLPQIRARSWNWANAAAAAPQPQVPSHLQPSSPSVATEHDVASARDGTLLLLLLQSLVGSEAEQRQCSGGVVEVVEDAAAVVVATASTAVELGREGEEELGAAMSVWSPLHSTSTRARYPASSPSQHSAARWTISSAHAAASCGCNSRG